MIYNLYIKNYKNIFNIKKNTIFKPYIYIITNKSQILYNYIFYIFILKKDNYRHNDQSQKPQIFNNNRFQNTSNQNYLDNDFDDN